MKAILSILSVLLFSVSSYGDEDIVVFACEGLAQHIAKLELGQDYDTLLAKVSLYDHQESFNLSDNQARLRVLVSEVDGVNYEYAMTATYDESNYPCIISDIDSI